MTQPEHDRPFAEHANRLQHMPWMLGGYKPIVETPSPLRKIARWLAGVTSGDTKH